MCFRPAAASTPKTCPACGMINPAVATKCIKCGEELPEDRVKCPHCGEMNIAGATVCSECGTKLTEDSSRPASKPVAIPSNSDAGNPPDIPSPSAPSAPNPLDY